MLSTIHIQGSLIHSGLSLLFVSYRQWSTRLEFIHLVLAVSEFLEVPLQLALIRRALLAAADSLVQAWWAADEDLDLVALLWLGQNRLQELLGYVALAALP